MYNSIYTGRCIISLTQVDAMYYILFFVSETTLLPDAVRLTWVELYIDI